MCLCWISEEKINIFKYFILSFNYVKKLIYVFWTWLCYNHIFEFNFDIYFQISFWVFFSKSFYFGNFQFFFDLTEKILFWSWIESCARRRKTFLDTNLCTENERNENFLASTSENDEKKVAQLWDFDFFSCKMLFLILLFLTIETWKIFENWRKI